MPDRCWRNTALPDRPPKMLASRRERPWKRLRVVVEVSVPPTSRATEKDLAYLLRDALPATVQLPRPIHDNAFTAPLRFKTLGSWLPAIRLKLKKGEPI